MIEGKQPSRFANRALRGTCMKYNNHELRSGNHCI
jgi:hypothetical protein